MDKFLASNGHITMLELCQVGKKFSELIRDTSTQTSGSDSARWINELTQVAIKLIAVLTSSGKETILAATDAAAPALKRIERAGIAAATPISYHSRELMQLTHEHLLGSGLAATAAMLHLHNQLLRCFALLAQCNSGYLLEAQYKL